MSEFICFQAKGNPGQIYLGYASLKTSTTCVVVRISLLASLSSHIMLTKRNELNLTLTKETENLET